MSVKKTLQNIILGFVPSRKMRHRIRLYMNVDVKKYVEFARRDAGLPNARVKIFQGHGGQKKMIVVLDNRVAYKFVLDPSRADGPRREKMFTDAFRDISPIPLPKMTVLNFNGFDVLKYDFVAGKTVANMDAKTLRKFTPIIAHQLAEFMFAVGGATRCLCANLSRLWMQSRAVCTDGRTMILVVILLCAQTLVKLLRSSIGKQRRSVTGDGI